MSDMPERLLAWLVRDMPQGRKEWGAAMLAELAHIQPGPARWGFALSCARAALFTGFPVLIAAALTGLILVSPFVALELRQDRQAFPYPLFAMLWLLPAVFVIAIAPLARTVRCGGVLAHPATLAIRVVLLALLAILWMGLIQDQMGCFLGAPNCD